MSYAKRTCVLIGLACVLGLAACATPQQRCVAQATADVRSLQAQIKTTEATIARGYALHRQSVPYTRTRICHNKEGLAFPCHRTGFHRIETPVTVDIDNEKAKLAQMKAKLAKVLPKALAAAKQCRKTYPE